MPPHARSGYGVRRFLRDVKKCRRKAKAKVSNLLDGYPVVVEFAVAWGEMDANRHVNSAVYFRYFENARAEYFRRLDWHAFERETGIGPILAATEARFHRPLAYPDRVSVGARVASVSADRLTMEYCVVSHDLNATTTLGRATVMAMHYPTAKKVPLPEELRRRIEQTEARPTRE